MFPDVHPKHSGMVASLTGRRVGDPPQETSAAPNLVKIQWERGEGTTSLRWDITNVTSHKYRCIFTFNYHTTGTALLGKSTRIYSKSWYQWPSEWAQNLCFKRRESLIPRFVTRLYIHTNIYLYIYIYIHTNIYIYIYKYKYVHIIECV